MPCGVFFFKSESGFENGKRRAGSVHDLQSGQVNISTKTGYRVLKSCRPIHVTSADDISKLYNDVLGMI
jgi:hypothetical protein